MKKLLILTDFSTMASHAAAYGYELAKRLKADIILCNAVIVAADIPLAGLAAWPLEERDTYLQNSKEEIILLKEHLELSNHNGEYQPDMTFVSDPGKLVQVLDDMMERTQVDLVVMGAHGGDQIHTFLFDDRCMNMIKTMQRPLLMVPQAAKFSKVKKIVFLIDVKHYADELKFIPLMLMLAKQLEAVVSVSCQNDCTDKSSDLEHRLKIILMEFSESDRSYISYAITKRNSKLMDINALDQYDADLLVVINRPDNFFDRLLHESETINTKNQLSVPLLIFKG